MKKHSKYLKETKSILIIDSNSDDDEKKYIKSNIIMDDCFEDTESDEEICKNTLKENNNEIIKKTFSNPTIRELKINYLEKNIINLKPNYQREFSWSFDKMCTFIDSLMRGYVIPLFILCENKLENNKQFECIDGQHRLTVLQKYIKSEQIEVGKYEKYIYFEKKKHIETNMKKEIYEKVFYNVTEEIKNKYKTNIREMTLNEKKYFNDIQLSFIIINTELTNIQKCEIFNRLQNGEKVSAITRIKNINNTITNYLRMENIFGENIINLFEKIIKPMQTKIMSEQNYLIEQFSYLIIRLIIIYDNKNLDIHYCNIHMRKYLEDNNKIHQIKGDIQNIFEGVIEIKNRIIKKFDNNKLISELFIIIFFIQHVNNVKYCLINKNSIQEILEKYNIQEKYKDKNKNTTEEIMNTNYNEIIVIIDKHFK